MKNLNFVLSSRARGDGDLVMWAALESPRPYRSSRRQPFPSTEPSFLSFFGFVWIIAFVDKFLSWGEVARGVLV
jgi:hypothetical protein